MRYVFKARDNAFRSLPVTAVDATRDIATRVSIQSIFYIILLVQRRNTKAVECKQKSQLCHVYADDVVTLRDEDKGLISIIILFSSDRLSLAGDIESIIFSKC